MRRFKCIPALNLPQNFAGFTDCINIVNLFAVVRNRQYDDYPIGILLRIQNRVREINVRRSDM